MQRIPNYKEYIAITDDIEFLRAELLQNHDLTNTLHRRVQENESVFARTIAQHREDIEILECHLKWYKEQHAKEVKRRKAINALPFPIRWIVQHYIYKLD